MTFLGLVTTNVQRRPLRSLLGLGSIAVMSFMCVVTLTFIQRQRMVDMSEASDSRLVVVPYDSGGHIPFTYAATIKQLPGVVDVQYVVTRRAFDPQADSAFTYTVWGASPAMLSAVPKSFVGVDPKLAAAWQQDRQAMLAPRGLADRFGWKPGTPATVTLSRAKTIQFNFLGYYDYGFQHGIYAHYEQLRDSTNDARLSRLVVTCEPARCPALLDEIDKQFETSSDTTFTMTEANFSGSVVQTASTIPTMLSFVGAMIILVTAIVTGCTISIALRERGTEIATLRALGFSRVQVSGLLFSESLLVAAIGGVVGALIPFVLTQIHPLDFNTTSMSVQNAFRSLVVQPQAVVISIGVAVAVGFAVALLPVLRVLRESVIEGLAG